MEIRIQLFFGLQKINLDQKIIVVLILYYNDEKYFIEYGKKFA